MRYFALITILSFLMMPLASLRAAEQLVYVTDVTNVSLNIYNSADAIGEPDELYADYGKKDTAMRLYFDQEIESDLKLYYYTQGFGAGARVEFYNGIDEKTDTWSDYLENETELVIEYHGTEPYQYVKISSIQNTNWGIDALETTVMIEDVEEPVEEEPIVDEEETSVDIGKLVKLPDDGDIETQYDSAVYEIGADGKRHAFPNETVFFSWYANFDDVIELTQEEMDAYSLGDNVTMRPGTYLIKIPSVADVFAVEYSSVLRKLANEQVAIDLYTNNWATMVRDVAETFWTNYEVGEPIETAVHPDGTLLEAPSGEVVYLNNGVYYSIPGDDRVQMRFQSQYQVPASEEVFANYVDGGNIVLLNYMLFPY
ncbi:MAG: hypothetical protein ABIG32_01285 [Candidatus Uhrbacteria bacterium]|nr:hypothetical protein [Patescibacteria group bacterium]MBU1907141.1 hypothetical protein [Patescibacteria group bacterium]